MTSLQPGPSRKEAVSGSRGGRGAEEGDDKTKRVSSSGIVGGSAAAGGAFMALASSGSSSNGSQRSSTSKNSGRRELDNNTHNVNDNNKSRSRSGGRSGDRRGRKSPPPPPASNRRGLEGVTAPVADSGGIRSTAVSTSRGYNERDGGAIVMTRRGASSSTVSANGADVTESESWLMGTRSSASVGGKKPASASSVSGGGGDDGGGRSRSRGSSGGGVGSVALLHQAYPTFPSSEKAANAEEVEVDLSEAGSRFDHPPTVYTAPSSAAADGSEVSEPFFDFGNGTA